jgi:quinol monooxygenase YgiN
MVAGCELYIINRSPSEPDVIWVTELWSSPETIDAALAIEQAKARMPLVQELVAGTERIELTPPPSGGGAA